MTAAHHDGAPTADDPIGWFTRAFEAAARSESFDPSRAALATVDAQGGPAVRFVLVKGVSRSGFAFYTNLRSPKGRQLEADPRAALCFHWSTTDTQVRVSGRVTRVSDAEADAYFASRPRESQLGAWASDQSSPIADRMELQAAYDKVEQRFANQTVPRPSHWSGYLLRPDTIEFWISREGRLHDRWQFERADGGWSMVRLQP